VKIVEVAVATLSENLYGTVNLFVRIAAGLLAINIAILVMVAKIYLTLK